MADDVGGNATDDLSDRLDLAGDRADTDQHGSRGEAHVPQDPDDCDQIDGQGGDQNQRPPEAQ